MASPTRSDRTSAFLRTFAIQGSWNYRTLLGAGLAYAMLPLLSRIHAGDPVAFRESVVRHASSFNAHPYLAAMAVGALSRLEHDGVDAATIERFRAAIRAPLGALGDRTVWAGWRPVCLLVAVVAFTWGLEGWKAALLFLGFYNAGHLWLRAWAFRRGWEAGLEVGTALARSVLDDAARWLSPTAVLLLGMATAGVTRTLPAADALGPTGAVAMLAAALLAYFFPAGGGVAGVLLLVAAAATWLA